MNSDPREPRIYFFPNLMTAGNLFCGYMALLEILKGILSEENATSHYLIAITFILGACLFDVLDGRLARLHNQDSNFGREFDSLADVISFGLAPAMLVSRMILREFPDRVGWIFGFIYLLCGTMRLARFNCLAAAPPPTDVTAAKFPPSTDFVGLPIPAAAGFISSLTLLLIWLAGHEREIGHWKWILPPMMLAVSYLMFSRITFPSFKALNFKSRISPAFLICAVVIGIFTVLNYEWMPAVLFTLYIAYGLGRRWISRKWRKEIEEIGSDSDGEDSEDPNKPIP